MSQNNRPLSPHLQIYQPQLTSILSVLHRATGMVITLGALVIAAWLWCIASGPDSYNGINAFLDSIYGRLLMIAWTFCTSYHLFNGVRHLVWDYGFGFELNQAYLSGKLVVVGAVVLSLLVWVL